METTTKQMNITIKVVQEMIRQFTLKNLTTSLFNDKDAIAEEDNFLRKEGEHFTLISMENINESLYDDGNVTDNLEFATLQHGDIVYNRAATDYREVALNVIRVSSNHQKFVEPIGGHNGNGIEINSNITSQIKNPILFYKNLEKYSNYCVYGLFIMLDSTIHRDIIHKHSNLTNVEQYKFGWLQHKQKLAIIHWNRTIDLEDGRIEDEYEYLILDNDSSHIPKERSISV